MVIKKGYLIIGCLMVMLAAGLIKPAYVQACSCAQKPTIESQLERKTAIFAGKVVSIVNPPKKLIMSSADPVQIVFEASEVWKGEVAESVSVYTAMSGASCGYEGFQLGDEFLVFAYGDAERLETGLCEGNMKLTNASPELVELGTGYAPLEAPVEEGRNETFSVWLAVSAAVLIAGVVILINFAMRRVKRQ